jgi:hypothetical protein
VRSIETRCIVPAAKNGSDVEAAALATPGSPPDDRARATGTPFSCST